MTGHILTPFQRVVGLSTGSVQNSNERMGIGQAGPCRVLAGGEARCHTARRARGVRHAGAETRHPCPLPLTSSEWGPLQNFPLYFL